MIPLLIIYLLMGLVFSSLGWVFLLIDPAVKPKPYQFIFYTLAMALGWPYVVFEALLESWRSR